MITFGGRSGHCHLLSSWAAAGRAATRPCRRADLTGSQTRPDADRKAFSSERVRVGEGEQTARWEDNDPTVVALSPRLGGETCPSAPRRNAGCQKSHQPWNILLIMRLPPQLGTSVRWRVTRQQAKSFYCRKQIR